jgi:hypothetical protein
MSDQSYINYFEVLGVSDACKAGEVRNSYKKVTKQLLMEIGRATITDSRRDTFLLEIAKLNAAYYILRDNDRRQQYIDDRARIISLEEQWHDAVEANTDEVDSLRRDYDGTLRQFLSKYMEELMLEAGRDRECVEASRWSRAHERHASRVLRHFRQRLFHEIHERLPYYQITPPKIDWDERAKWVSRTLADGSAV